MDSQIPKMSSQSSLAANAHISIYNRKQTEQIQKKYERTYTKDFKQSKSKVQNMMHSEIQIRILKLAYALENILNK